jgi:hypothetical protein
MDGGHAGGRAERRALRSNHVLKVRVGYARTNVIVAGVFDDSVELSRYNPR